MASGKEQSSDVLSIPDNKEVKMLIYIISVLCEHYVFVKKYNYVRNGWLKRRKLGIVVLSDKKT